MINFSLHTHNLQRYMDEMISVCMHDDFSFNSLYDKKMAVRLAQQWNIDDLPTLLMTMNWLLHEGYQAEFEGTRHFLSTFSEKDRKLFINSLPDSDNRKRRLAITEQTWGCLPEGGIAAFDYAWYIVLATMASTLKLIGKNSLKRYSIQAARKAQSAYSGWTEYLFGYTVGAEFSGRYHPGDFNSRNETYFLQLQNAWQQPINKVNWNLRLQTF